VTAFGATLKRIRERRRISQSRLAELANVDHSLVSRYESGGRFPTRETIAILAEELDASDEETAELMTSAGFIGERNAYVFDQDCANLANLLATVDQERGEWIRATVRNLIAMNAA
jgi:transcriptional regulator with XRE-family HTH domain